MLYAMFTQVFWVSGRHPEYLHQYTKEWRERETDECEKTACRRFPTAFDCYSNRAGRLYARGRCAVGILPSGRDKHHHLPGSAEDARFSAIASLTNKAMIPITPHVRTIHSLRSW